LVIDQAKLLRILLELYKREKKIKVFILRRLWHEQPKLPDSPQKQHCIGFEGFKTVLTQFDPNITDIDISRYF